MKQRIKAGGITPDSSLIKFSDEAIDEQKHAIRIADEKVALAVQAYDLVQIMKFYQFFVSFDNYTEGFSYLFFWFWLLLGSGNALRTCSAPY